MPEGIDPRTGLEVDNPILRRAGIPPAKDQALMRLAGDTYDQSVGRRLDGIDVAKYNPILDWNQVRAAVPWFCTKATLGSTVVDPTFRGNRAAMHAFTFPYKGIYHWLTPSSSVSSQVAHFFNVVGTDLAGEFVMLDAEEAGINAAEAKEWCDRVENVIQKPVGVYTGLYVADLWRSTALFNGLRPRIVAYYTTNESTVRIKAFPYLYDCWQYIGSGGRCPGVSGDVDNDKIVNWAAFDRAVAKPVPPPPPPAPPPIFGPVVPNPKKGKRMLFKPAGLTSVYLVTPDGQCMHIISGNSKTSLEAQIGPTAELDPRDAKALLALYGMPYPTV